MPNVLPSFEPGNTVQFTFVSSVQPDAAPGFSVVDQDGTVVASFTSLTSGTTAYYALYTMPNSAPRHQIGKWTAQKTVNGSAYNFVRSLVFRVQGAEVP